MNVIRVRHQTVGCENGITKAAGLVFVSETENVAIRKNSKTTPGDGAIRKRCKRIETSVESTIRTEAAVVVGYRGIEESKTGIDKRYQGSSIGLTREAAGDHARTRFMCRRKSIINCAVRIQARHTK